MQLKTQQDVKAIGLQWNFCRLC